jgi:hypothetical protein
MNDTLMWEARVVPGRRDDLLRWVERTVLPALAGSGTAEVYSGGEDRFVVIVRWSAAPGRLPDPPEGLLARAAHQWPFRHHGTARDMP